MTTVCYAEAVRAIVAGRPGRLQESPVSQTGWATKRGAELSTSVIWRLQGALSPPHLVLRGLQTLSSVDTCHPVHVIATVACCL